MALLLIVSLYAIIIGVTAAPPVACTNPATGTATHCVEVANPLKSGSNAFPWSCNQPTSTFFIPCECPEDTCVTVDESPPYSGSPVSYVAEFPQCQALNGVGYFGLTYFPSGCSPDVCTSVMYCSQTVRSSCRNGDVPTGLTEYGPYYPYGPGFDTHTTEFFCSCDCGYTHASQFPTLCTATTSVTTSCQNPLTADFVNFVVVTWPSGCKDPFGNTVRCFCPIDTCATYVVNGITYPECRVFNGVGTTGVGWNTQIANNNAFMFCFELFRYAGCNGHGDAITGTMFLSPEPLYPYGGDSCQCDCGWVDVGMSHCSGTNFNRPVCVNPTTMADVTFVQVVNPENNSTMCTTDGPCWCPVDTCVAITAHGITRGECLPPYSGGGYNTTIANNNNFILCTQPYNWAVCNGHGHLPSFYASYSPLAPYTNPPGPCVCDTQWWDTTYSDGVVARCNFQSNCSISTRMGFENVMPCGGHGTCLRNSSCVCQSGWGGPACDQNILCPSSSPNLECSGLGTCYQYTQPEFYLVFGGWVQGSAGRVYGFPVNITCPYSPPGLLFSVPNAAQSGIAFQYKLNQNASPQPTQIFNLPRGVLKTACCAGQLQAGASYGCFKSLLEFLFNGTYGTQWRSYLSTNGYTNNMQQYVIDTFTAYYPMLGSIDPSWMAPSIAGFTSTDIAVNAATLSLLLSYETFVDFTVQTGELPAPYPLKFPSYQCICNTRGYTPGTPGSLAGGADCSAQCVYDEVNGQVCGGITNGFKSGSCNLNSGVCSCAPGFVTATTHANPLGGCNLDLVGLCVDPNSPGQVCSTPGCSNSECTQQTGLQGVCNQITVNISSPVAKCVCGAGWKGTYCQTSVCSNTTVQCSFNGVCDGPSKTCICNGLSPSNTQLLSNPPPLWAGSQCSVNAITQCGHFIQLSGAPAGTGTWTVCDNVGTCKQNTSHAGSPYACFCTGRNFGAQCQFTGCSPACNASTQFCNLASGTCSCQPMWGGPSCTQNLCQHGHPNSKGTACVCDPFYTTASSGLAVCSQTQCPFVANTVATGIRACNYTAGDQNCVGSPLNTVGCCYNGCPGSSCTIVGGQPQCACNPTFAFNQVSGICFPICHAGSYFATSPLVCNCAAVKQLLNPTSQYIDGFCNIFACANGGVVHNGGCTCPSTWTGAQCTTNACKNGGTPGPNNVCVCANGYGGSLCATAINPNPPDPGASSSSSGGGAHSSSSARAVSSSTAVARSSSSTGTSRSSSTGSTHPSSSSSGASSASSSSTGSGSPSSTAVSPASSSPALSTGSVIAISSVAAAVGVTGIVLLGIFLNKLLTGSGPAWAALPKSPPVPKKTSP